MGHHSPKATTTDPAEDAAVDADPLQAGELLAGRYRVVEQLGSGGFGQVVAARDTHDDRRVAVKILRADADSRDPAAVARMRQEAEILEAVDHPSIVELYGVDDRADSLFMVMELLDGPSVADLLERDGPAAAGQVAPLVGQLLSALEAAHQKHVLHRDIKPDNIIVVADDDAAGGRRAKLLDFGIAKAQTLLDDDPDEGVTLVETRGGGFVGTPRYCAPEIAVGDPADASADLFSLGLVVAEWLTGRTRIDADTQAQVLSVLIQPEPLDVSDCPKPWQPWLARVLAKSPAQRYDSARQARAAFVALVEGDGDDVDLAQTTEHRPLSSPDLGSPDLGSPDLSSPDRIIGDDDVSETAKTTVRDLPSARQLADAAPADDAQTGHSLGRLVVITAVSCAVVLLILVLLRHFLT